MKTLVVRWPDSSRGGAGAFRDIDPNIGGDQLENAVQSGLSIAVAEDMSTGDRADLERRPEYLVADAMPLSLIGPLEANANETADNAIDEHLVDGGDGSRIAWGVDAVGAARSAFDGSGVRVAVLDSGLDENHPAFADPSLQIVKRNFTLDVDKDVNGHGTHCAGTIFGRAVDNVRIGVAPGVRHAFAGKVIPGDLGDLINAMNWAFDNGAKVISMSLGFDYPGLVTLLTSKGLPQPAAVSVALQQFRKNLAVFDAQMALFRARALADDGAVVIAAAGNESQREAVPPYTIGASPPSVAEGIVPIGALGRTANGLKIANFSNTNPEIVAPGVDVVSAEARTGRLVALSGTSMACPHVAGLAALYWHQFQSQGGGFNGARKVTQRLMVSGGTGALAPGFRSGDIGNGMPVAP